jgi:DNA-binding response OmpR family regulator
VRVLICDDERDIRVLYRSAFELQGVDVTVANDGDDCVRAAEQQPPDMLVLDLMMPGRDGFSTMAEFHERWPSTPVYVVSAYASPENFTKSRTLGALDCFDKLDFLGRIPGLIASTGTAA